MLIDSGGTSTAGQGGNHFWIKSPRCSMLPLLKYFLGQKSYILSFFHSFFQYFGLVVKTWSIQLVSLNMFWLFIYFVEYNYPWFGLVPNFGSKNLVFNLQSVQKSTVVQEEILADLQALLADLGPEDGRPRWALLCCGGPWCGEANGCWWEEFD